jgi:hypothetical protein
VEDTTLMNHARLGLRSNKKTMMKPILSAQSMEDPHKVRQDFSPAVQELPHSPPTHTESGVGKKPVPVPPGKVGAYKRTPPSKASEKIQITQNLRCCQKKTQVNNLNWGKITNKRAALPPPSKHSKTKTHHVKTTSPPVKCIQTAPWTRFDQLNDLIELNISVNRLTGKACTLVDQQNTNSNSLLTCSMIESFRT